MNGRLKKLQSETVKLMQDTTLSQSAKERLASPTSQYSSCTSEDTDPQLLTKQSFHTPGGDLTKFGNNTASSFQKSLSLSSKGDSTPSNILLKKEKDLQFLQKLNKPENKVLFQKSLGDVLRQRREHQEKMEIERVSLQQSQQNFRHANPPKECDNRGTAFRIRPQTPKLNLLGFQKEKIKGRKQRKALPLEHKQQQQLLQLQQKHFSQPQMAFTEEEVKYQDEEIRDDLSSQDDYQQTQEDDEAIPADGCGMLSNFQEKFIEIIENNEDIEDAIELNEVFLAQHLGVRSEDLSRLTKIELRVDTSCHNLQVTGEILSSLEYLKMNDSIIKCFRDIGTSFKWVRVLHLARCELKEVQGISALEQLEELYMSYNDIDELFDIGFLEHLTVLDMEGNNIKSLDQLYYLKRCQSLTDINLKYNPVANEVAYYQRISDNVPRICSLDDELIEPGYFERKTEENKKSAILRNITSPRADSALSELTQRLINIGVKEELINRVCGNDLTAITQEPKECDLLVNSIKNQTKEKKAQQQSYPYWSDLFDDGRPGSARRVSSASGKEIGVFKRTSTDSFSKDGMRATSNSLFKTSRSTAISSQESMRTKNIFYSASKEDNHNGVSDLVSNNDQVMSGTPFSVLRRRNSKQMPAFSVNTNSGTIMPKDITSLLNEFHVDFKSNFSKEEIRSKITDHSSKQSSSTIKEYIEDRKEFIPNSGQNTITSTGTSVLSSLNFRKSVKTPFGGIGVGNGPIKADRIILKTQDVSLASALRKNTKE